MVQKNEQKSAEKLWEARNTQLQNVSQFLMQARASYGRLMPVKADLRWQQNADDTFEIRVSGPFGVGATTISGRPDSVEVRTRNGTYQSNDPEQWIQAKMGWTLPLAGLRFWALGVPSPHSDAEVDLDREGRALLLEQDGWTLNYTEYQQAGARIVHKDSPGRWS